MSSRRGLISEVVGRGKWGDIRTQKKKLNLLGIFFIFFLEIVPLMLSSPWPPLAAASTVTNVANNSNNGK